MADFNFRRITLAAKFTPPKKQILWVDDNRFYIECGKKALEILRYDPLAALSGRQALKIYQKHSNEIRLVILEMTIPDIPWRHVYNELLEINPGLKVLLITGTKGDDLGFGLPRNGTVQFFRKPFTIHELSQKISSIIEESLPSQEPSQPSWAVYHNNRLMGAINL